MTWEYRSMVCRLSTWTRAELADLAQVIAAQVHQHVVLGQLLLVGQQFLFQSLVLLVGLAAGPGTGQGEGVEHAVLQLHQRLRGGPGHLHVRPGEVEHVGGGVRGPQDAVGVQQASRQKGALSRLESTIWKMSPSRI